MTEKRQTSQGYIIRTLQHFATKPRNITNFVMLFPDLSRSKFHSKGERSIRFIITCIAFGRMVTMERTSCLYKCQQF
jgi:hypothetical protein